MGILRAMTHHFRMNSIFTVHRTHECDIFSATMFTHKFFEIGEVFPKTVEGETLFK